MVGGLQAAGERAMGRLRDESDDRGVTVETGVVEGLPSETICSHADQSGADIVVMSTHGRTGLEHFFLGSVTERVVRNSTTPVLTTPTRGADTDADGDSGETD